MNMFDRVLQEQMAKKYAIHNIEFRQADILQLPQLQRRFDVIECVGVLHHMQDPLQGWQILTKLLTPQGVMCIGLYSTLARHEIIQLRQTIQTLNLTPSKEDIRQLRSLILKHKLGELGKSVLRNVDFYSTSACRDLLFHVQEQSFFLKDIQTHLHALKLDFLGFHQLAPALRTAYLQRYLDDPHCTNLTNWQAFEIQHPDLFKQCLNLRMYTFWCQKKL